jgi:hypothetical protein
VDSRGSTGRLQRRTGPALLVPAAVVILLAGVGGTAAVLAGSRHNSASRQGAASVAGAGQPLPTASPGTGKKPAKAAGGAAAPQPGRSGRPTAAAGSGSSASPRSSGSSGSGSSGSPPEPALVVPTQSVPLSLTGAVGGRPAGEYGGTFPISAVNGPVTFTISEPAGEANSVEVSYASGTETDLTAGQTLTDTVEPGDPVTITVVFFTRPDLEPPYEITVNPGGATITFTLS